MVDQQKYKVLGLLESLEPSAYTSLNYKNLCSSKIISPETVSLLEYAISADTPPNNKTWGQK